MANARHLELLKQGVEEWNQWRKANPDIKPDLSGANLSESNLRKINLGDAELGEINLRGADLHDAYLRFAQLVRADLSGADLREANLRFANLYAAKLLHANLCEADMHRAELRRADLSGAELSRVTLSGAYLNYIDLSHMDLRDTNLSGAQVLGTKFEKAVLTGACLEDWNINGATSFKGVICEYIYLRRDQRERRPRENTFKPGEFAALFQQAANTVDLIFKDGIDWQAFFQSFQDLSNQYADQDLSIQAIEKKRDGAFVIRVEVAEGADKAAIESSAKELYASEVKALEAQYEERLLLQGQHLEDARQTIEVERQAVETERRDKATLMGVIQTMAISQQGPKYDMRGAHIAGGVADTVGGNQVGGTINNYGPNTERLPRILCKRSKINVH